MLIDAVWRGTARKATDAELHQALVLARLKPGRGPTRTCLPCAALGRPGGGPHHRRVVRRNLSQVASCLHRAGIPAVLIQVGMPGDHVGASIDLVIPEQHWRGALTALADWYVHALDVPARALRYSPALPINWARPAPAYRHLLVRCSGASYTPTADPRPQSRGGFLIPAPADYLRIWLAQALFQNLTLDLSRLLAVRDLLRPPVITAARAEASREGWRADFDGALAAAGGAIDSLDRGLPVNLPVPMPVSQSLGKRTGASASRAPDGDARTPLTKTRRCGYCSPPPKGKGR